MKFAPSPWKSYLAVTISVVVFLALSVGLVQLQQRIVQAALETKGVLVPEIQMKFRLARNIDLLRNYGNLSQRTTDPALRRRAAALAALAVDMPVNMTDEELVSLMSEGHAQIVRMAQDQADPVAWSAIDRQLAEKADRLASVANELIVARTTKIHGDAVLVRNYALAQAAIFSACVALLVFWGRVLMGQMRARNLLFSELSHDFRQRVHGMQLSLSLVGPIPNGAARGEIAKALGSITDLHRYLDNFLDMTRMETVTVAVTPCRVEISELFQSLALQFEDEADLRGVDLCFRHSPLVLHSDRSWLTRVMENLIANALKFAKGKVLVAARPRGSGVQLLIMDDGVGMPASHLDEGTSGSFIRGPNASLNDHGFGLGLAMVRRTVRLLGATLSIRSKPDRGTLVRIHFHGA